MADLMDVQIDMEQVKRAIGQSDSVYGEMQKAVNRLTASANSACAGYKTGYFYDRTEGKRKGGTQAVYASKCDRLGRYKWPYGVVYAANYSAMKDNYEHNTLLKAVSHG